MTRPAGALAIAGLIVTGGLTGASPVVCLLPGPFIPQSSQPSQLSQPSGPTREDVDRLIDRLGSFDVDVRTDAARAIRRAPGTVALPALMDAASGHADGFVRRRALVLISGYDDPRVPDQMEVAVTEANEGLRTIAFRYFERHPAPRLTPVLLKALSTEAGEFARPALIRALAAHGRDLKVQRALLQELSRGADATRGTTIEALGDHKATYALKSLAPIAKTEGPFQAQAALALCQLANDCSARRDELVKELDEPGPYVGFEAAVRDAAFGLSTLAAGGDAAAGRALVAAATDADERLGSVLAEATADVVLRRADSAISFFSGADNTNAAIAVLRRGLAARADDFGEEQLFAQLRAGYFAEAEGSPVRELIQTLINTLEF